jgi:7,8-dihydropterin-6-yl-methyl-4-(beta-D-ribofuranosyl)aminobenzene 5'-phosphate synthase
MQEISLEPVDAIEITTLVDNQWDMLLQSQERAVRPSMSPAGRPTVEAPFFIDPQLPEMLIAEHGFSVLVSITTGGKTRRLMFDAGLSVDGLAHNLHALQISLADVEGIVMSHGHFDHVGGLHGLAREGGQAAMPMLLHPDFWLRRRAKFPAGAFELPVPSRGAMLGAGFEIVEERQPSLLLDRSVLITGEVDRTTSFEKGFAIHQAWRDGDWTPDPLILDDQALIAHVRGKGLVVLTGCGHSGIVNIVRYAQKLTGVDQIAAIVGGFHLGGPLFAPILPQTVAALTAFEPGMIVPGHCTGFEAVRAISLAMPEAFVINSVGTRFIVAG